MDGPESERLNLNENKERIIAEQSAAFKLLGYRPVYVINYHNTLKNA